MEALDKLQDNSCLGIYRESNSTKIVTWNKTRFEHFYTGKTLEINKQELFAGDWKLLLKNGE